MPKTYKRVGPYNQKPLIMSTNTTAIPADALEANRFFFNHANIESFQSAKWLSADNFTCYTLTGIIRNADFKGERDWVQQDIQLTVNIPLLTAGKGLHLKYWAPYVTLNSVFNAGQSINSGFSINRYKVINRQTDPRFGQTTLTLLITVAARDTDAWVHRIGFTVTLVGTEKPLQHIPPIPVD
jgi:hypothetical protein